MKKCPFCAEMIQDEAVKCRFCNEFLDGYQPVSRSGTAPWYFHPLGLVVAFLCFGPLMLPLVWLHPGLSHRTKIFITSGLLVLTLIMMRLFLQAWEGLAKYFAMLKGIY